MAVKIWIWMTYSLNSLEVAVEVEVVVVASNSISGQEVKEVVEDNSNKKKFLFFSRTLMSFLLILALFSSSIGAKKYGSCISSIPNFKNAKTLKRAMLKLLRNFTV